MSLTAEFRPEAARELEDAYDWYEERQEGLGERLKRAAMACVQQALENPEYYPVVAGETRRASLRRFPYGLFCGVAGGRLTIYAVFHASRDPHRLERRLEGRRRP